MFFKKANLKKHQSYELRFRKNLSWQFKNSEFGRPLIFLMSSFIIFCADQIIKQYCALWCIWFGIHFARPICIPRPAIYPPVVISYYFLCQAWQRNFEFFDKSYICIYCDQHKSRPATPPIECKLNVYSQIRYDGLTLITIGRFPG